MKILFPQLLCLNTYIYHLSHNQAEQNITQEYLSLPSEFVFLVFSWGPVSCDLLLGFPSKCLNSCLDLHPLQMLQPTGLYWGVPPFRAGCHPTIILTRLIPGMIWYDPYIITLVRLTYGIKDGRNWGEPPELGQESKMIWRWSGHQDVYWVYQSYLWNSQCLVVCIPFWWHY